MMQSIFNLIPSDIGRPISHIRFDIDISDLETLVLEVLETLNTLEREVQDSEGHWYLLRVRPYRTVDNRIDGAVLVLVDIDNLKRVEQALRQSEDQLSKELSAINQVHELSYRLFTTFDLEQALQEVLQAAITLHSTTMGTMQLYDPDRGVLEIVAHQGLEQDFLDHFREVRLDDGSVCSRILEEGRRVIVEDIQIDPAYEPHLQIAAAAGYRAVQSTPLINRTGVLFGVLSTHFAQPYRPTERELRMLDLYGRQASEFIDRMRLAGQEQRLMLERERIAQAANASKDEFLSVLSHELRTPLTSLLGWVQLIERGLVDESLNEAIAAIKGSASVQLRLVEDLLDASRIIQDRFQVTLQPTDLRVLLQQSISLAQPQAVEKGVQLETELGSCLDRLAIDPDRMAQAFSNLLSNAIKFTPSGGRITVRLADLSTHAQVQVSDTGQGIAPEIAPHVFDRFRQADASDQRREGGLGLGLFLVRSIVEAHGGTVEAESLGEGQGATFTITLPKAAAEPVEPTAPMTPTTEISLEGVRILLVEDSEENLSVFTFFLEALGAQVSTARTAAEALDIITRQPLDILVSDIGLPDINGYGLMRQVRSLPPEQGGRLPAIALTGYVSKQDIEAALAAGFQRHLAKPLELEDLAEAVYTLIQV